MLHWMPQPSCSNLIWFCRVHKVWYAWPQWGHRRSLHGFCVVISYNGGIHKLSATDWFRCPILKCLRTTLTEKRFFIRMLFFSVININIHLHSNVVTVHNVLYILSPTTICTKRQYAPSQGSPPDCCAACKSFLFSMLLQHGAQVPKQRHKILLEKDINSTMKYLKHQSINQVTMTE